jgi:hypothetical protein
MLNCLSTPYAPRSKATYAQPATHARWSYRLQFVGACWIVNADEFRVGLPVECHVKVTGKDLPRRSIVKLDKVTFGM